MFKKSLCVNVVVLLGLFLVYYSYNTSNVYCCFERQVFLKDYSTFNSSSFSIANGKSYTRSAISAKPAKLRKRYRYWHEGGSVLRLPFKIVKQCANSLQSASMYSAPHFLSLIHHYLFRLTPF